MYMYTFTMICIWDAITAFAAHVLVIHDLLTNSLHITVATTIAVT